MNIQTVTPTICWLMGIAPPGLSIKAPLADAVKKARSIFRDAKVEKCLVYAPDAMGNHLYRHSPQLFADVARLAPIRVSLQSVVPPITPVCFASMFTGAAPDRHRIRKHEQPVLECDTLFDALLRAGKRVAIVAVKDSSIDRIFRGRAVEYFSESYDPIVTERVISLLEAGRHDFILAYHQEYDDVMHATGPFSEAAMDAARNNVAGLVRMAKAFDEGWSRYPRMIIFTPDHGAHFNKESGNGSHGVDIPEDMEVNHYYGFRRAEDRKEKASKPAR